MSENKLDFSGENFSREPMSEDELAKHRQFIYHYQRNFMSPEELVEALGIQKLVMVGRAIPGFLVVVSMASAYLVLTNMGILP